MGASVSAWTCSDGGVLQQKDKLTGVRSLLGLRRQSSFLGVSRQTHIYLDAPVVTLYSAICALVMTADAAAEHLYPDRARLVFRVFAAQPRRFFDPLSALSYWRLVAHSLAFPDWGAMAGAVALVLLTGPHCEEHYGSRALAQLMLACSFVSGLLHTLLVPTSCLIGAQDILFMLILLNSISVYRFDRVPLTFLLTCFAYLSKEVLEAFREDGDGDGNRVAHASHIIAGMFGGFAGLVLSRAKQKKRLQKFAKALRPSCGGQTHPAGGGFGGGANGGGGSWSAPQRGILRSGMSIYMAPIGESEEESGGEEEEGEATESGDDSGGGTISGGGKPPLEAGDALRATAVQWGQAALQGPASLPSPLLPPALPLSMSPQPEGSKTGSGGGKDGSSGGRCDGAAESFSASTTPVSLSPAAVTVPPAASPPLGMPPLHRSRSGSVESAKGPSSGDGGAAEAAGTIASPAMLEAAAADGDGAAPQPMRKTSSLRALFPRSDSMRSRSDSMKSAASDGSAGSGLGDDDGTAAGGAGKVTSSRTGGEGAQRGGADDTGGSSGGS